MMRRGDVNVFMSPVFFRARIQKPGDMYEYTSPLT